MGQEIVCKARIGGKVYDAKLLFETEEIIVRWDGQRLALDVGAANAQKWLEKIRNPKSRIDKIGVKAGQRVSVIGVDDPELVNELTSLGADVSAKPRKGSDAIFYGANANGDLDKLAKLKESLAPNGALWVIRPKGTKEITEAATMAAGKAAGLVDVKVVKFSETHTAEKFVIPVARRQ